MDNENNFDSDTSESWSLVDGNDNGSGTDISEGIDTSTVPVNYSLSMSDTKISENPEKNQSEDRIQEVDIASSLSKSSNMASSKESSKSQQDFQILFKGKVFEEDFQSRMILSEFNSSKTSFGEAEKLPKAGKVRDIDNDTDSISIISESECNDFKLSTYETDEILEEKVSESNVPVRNNPGILKRKRKRLKLNYRESSEESVSSDFMVPDDSYCPSFQTVDFKKSNSEMQVQEYQSAPVYRHYRNNVANTVLTLAMGVIFTVVACVAIGHFLGVHDAQHTAGEMMETLKRLQMENVLLHTRLAQLSRAFFSRGNNKLELRSNTKPQYCLGNLGIQENLNELNKNNLNEGDAIKNPVLFRGVSFDIFTRMKDPVDELTYKEPQESEKLQILKPTYDQPKFFNITNNLNTYSKVTYSSTAPINDGDLYYKFVPQKKKLKTIKKKLKHNRFRLNRKNWKRFITTVRKYIAKERRNSKDDYWKGNCHAVWEKDVIRFRWHFRQRKVKNRTAGKSKEKSEGEKDKAIYEFPQPEIFYKSEADNSAEKLEGKFKWGDSCDEMRCSKFQDNLGLKFTNPRNSTNLKEKGKEYNSERRKHSLTTKKERKADDEDKEKTSESTEFHVAETKTTRKEKSHKKISKQINISIRGHVEEINKKYKCDPAKKNCKMKGLNKKQSKERELKRKSKTSTEGDENSRNREAPENNCVKGKDQYCKKHRIDNMRPKKELPSHMRRRAGNFRGKKFRVVNVRLKYSFPIQSECEECASRSGSWFDRLMKGREKHRRNKKVSEWQFERANSRANSRVGDAFWQFGRALGRESSRSEADNYFRKKGSNSQHKGFSSDAYSWI